MSLQILQLSPLVDYYFKKESILLMCSLSDRVEALAFKVWRDYITNMIQTAAFDSRRDSSAVILRSIRGKLAHFEDELPKLKERQ